MKIDSKKLETAFPWWSAIKFHFSVVSFLHSFLSQLFIRFSNTTSCQWLPVNKIAWKIKRLFKLGT